MALATSMTVPAVGSRLMFSVMIGPATAGRAVHRPARDRYGSPVVIALAAVLLSIALPHQLAGRLPRRRGLGVLYLRAQVSK